MKTFKNGKTKIALTKEITAATFAELAIQTLRNKPDGLSIDDIFSRKKIIDILSKDKKEYSLEDADYNILKNCIKQRKWGFLDDALLPFLEPFKS